MTMTIGWILIVPIGKWIIKHRLKLLSLHLCYLLAPRMQWEMASLFNISRTGKIREWWNRLTTNNSILKYSMWPSMKVLRKNQARNSLIHQAPWAFRWQVQMAGTLQWYSRNRAKRRNTDLSITKTYHYQWIQLMSPRAWKTRSQILIRRS